MRKPLWLENTCNWMKRYCIIAMTIGWLVAGLVLLTIYLRTYSADKTINWQMLTGFATWVLVAGVGVATWQIREGRRSTNAQIAVSIFRELRSDEVLERIRFIYSLRSPSDIQKLHIADLRRIEYVLDRLDSVAVLVEEGLVDEKLAVDLYAGVTAIRCWYVLYQLINTIRDDRKYYGDNFEAFTNRCMKYFDRMDIEVGFTTVHISEENLVKKLNNLEKECDPAKRKLYPRSMKQIKKQRNNTRKTGLA